MTKWMQKQSEVIQLITPDGNTFDLTSESDVGNWVLDISGLGMPDIDYISQQGPFQHGVSVRDYRLKSRAVQIHLRQQACDRDDYWSKRTELLNALRPNRDSIEISGALIARSAASMGGQSCIYDLAIWSGELYGGTDTNGFLFKWTGDNWRNVAPQLDGQVAIYSLVEYGSYLYGGTGLSGNLFRWDGSAPWVNVAAQLNGQVAIWDLATFDDGLGGGNQIFGCTGNGGRLFKSSGAAWSQVCAQLGAETLVLSLLVFDDGGGDDLYGGTGVNGMLYRYNPGGAAWVQVCAQLNAQTHIYSLCEYNSELYASTGPGGRLFRYDITGGAWTQVAAQYGTCTAVYKLIVFHGRLYGVGVDGYLLRWNNTDAWEEVALAPQNEDLRSAVIFNNRLFIGGCDSAYLFEYIARAGSTTLPCATLRRYLSDGSVRDLCVHIDKGPEFSSTKRGWDEFAIDEVIRLWAPDPILYDPTEQDGPAYTMDPGATGTVNESQIVTYEGNWETHPTLVITGPIESPIIRNEDTDEFIELDYDIPAGRVVTITLTPGNQTVEDDLGINLMGSVTPESNLQGFHLAPDPEIDDGVNEISIQGTGTNAATDFSFTYYNRYIGI